MKNFDTWYNILWGSKVMHFKIQSGYQEIHIILLTDQQRLERRSQPIGEPITRWLKVRCVSESFRTLYKTQRVTTSCISTFSRCVGTHIFFPTASVESLRVVRNWIDWIDTFRCTVCINLSVPKHCNQTSQHCGRFPQSPCISYSPALCRSVPGGEAQDQLSRCDSWHR